MKNLLGKKILIALVVLTIWQARTFGQPAYSQGFDSNGSQSPNGPANLVSEGWTFRNQSDNHLANAGWFDGDAFNQTPQAGSSCLYTASAQTIPFLQGGALSNWAILPEIPNQSAGSILTFFLFGSSAALGDQVLQVRFSPTGGTATGSNSASVGDFTQLLASFNTSPAWLQATVTLPGPGRIALRQMDPFVSNFPNGGVSLKVDSLTIASEATSPCGISLPQPGETVTWTQANSPYDVCSQLTIPRQGTVIVEPGVTISVQSGGPQLVIEGRLIAHGTSVSPIDFVGENFSIIDPPFEVSGGTLDMRFATVSARIQSKYGATILAADCDIPATGAISADPLQALDPNGVNPQALTFRIERCTFEGGELAAVSNVYVADTSFVGGSARVSGYVYLNNVTTNGIPLEFEKDAGAQSALIDHVSVTNSNSTAGLKLSGANYHIGPDTLIQGNLYPVEFTVLAAGLTPDSVLPATGNTANEILAHAFDGGNQITWPDLGLPYIVDRNVESAGSLTVLPGVNIHFEQTGGAIFNGLPVRMSGTFAKPIVLEPVNSNLGWVGIEFFQVATQLVQNVRLSGAQFGVGSDESLVSVIDSVFKDNNVAGTANTFGTWTARNCQFFDNAVGLQTGNTTNAGSFDASGTTMPNSFVGNDVGVQVNSPLASNTSTAAECWWGDASGPTHPNNPGGTGDYAGIQISRVVPFLFEAPTYSNHAPMVEMEPGPLFAHVGDRIIVRWSVVDDGPIVTQRIEYSQAAGGFPFVTLAELGPNERSWEYEVQSVPPTPVNSRAAVRVVTVDDAGNESWDVVSFWVPYQEDWTVPAIEVPAPTQLRPGDFYDVTWSPTATASVFLDVGSEGTLNLIPAGGHVGSGNNPKRMPYASTDLARIMVQFTYGAGGREEYYVSDYFTLRPDPQIADDAPPTVELISPTPGSVYPGGGTIPVAWTASDDDGLRNFDIQASYDGGVTWWSIARSISPTTTSFNWHLPPSIGITDVRVRVIARDVRFQTSSDGTTVAFGIAPGAGTVPGDIDGDGDLDFQDLELFAGVLVDADPDSVHQLRSDINHDGNANGEDIIEFMAILLSP